MKPSLAVEVDGRAVHGTGIVLRFLWSSISGSATGTVNCGGF